MLVITRGYFPGDPRRGVSCHRATEQVPGNASHAVPRRLKTLQLGGIVGEEPHTERSLENGLRLRMTYRPIRVASLWTIGKWPACFRQVNLKLSHPIGRIEPMKSVSDANHSHRMNLQKKIPQFVGHIDFSIPHVVTILTGSWLSLSVLWYIL